MAQLDKKTLTFLKNLNDNNSKEWFDAHRKDYDTAKENFIEIADAILKGVSAFDKDIDETNPKNCIFRINRDVRFSKDKSPYKNNFGMYFAKGGKKSNYSGYYLHIQPGASFIGGGLWMPESNVIKKIRQEIDYNGINFQKIILNKEFARHYKGLDQSMKLDSVPRGYDKEHPYKEFLKLKSFVTLSKLSDKEVTGTEFVKTALEYFKALMPFVKYLNTAVD